MMVRALGVAAAIMSLLFSAGLTHAAASGGAGGSDVLTGPDVQQAVHFDVSPQLKDIPNGLVDGDQKHEGRPLRLIPPNGANGGHPDTVVQSSAGPLVGTTNGLNFAGVGQGDYNFSDAYAPPDTNGAVGATQYVQWVNVNFAVFDKATGALIKGPTAGNSLWSGFGGGCQANNDGDPIVQYDKAANRWIFTQFSVSSPSTYGYLQCVAVSTTSDATGAYYRYAFSEPNFNDYPKLGVWPDGYYLTFNMFANNGNTFNGARTCVLDRAAMLAGQPNATQQCFQLSTSYGSLLPADLDGSTPPPAGSPEYLINLGGNSLNLWKFHVDWTTPTKTSLTGPTNFAVAPFTLPCNGGGTCIPQPGTTQQLDSLGDRPMYRLEYRNFGSHESLVFDHTVQAGTSTSTGMRWYEIWSPGGTPTINQQGTYAPDSNYRWMGSIAMDHAGDMAMGYSESNGTNLYPSIEYTGRVSSDPANTMEAENSIVTGAGSQNSSNLSRWGDYSAMSVDPVGDCTFWYTNEYLKSSGSFNWSTRIASFSFPGCTPTPNFGISAAPLSSTVTQGNTASYTVSTTASNGFNGSVGLTTSGLPAGATASFSPSSISGSGSSTLSVTTTSSTPAGTYQVEITGTNGNLTPSTMVQLVVNAAPQPDFTIGATPSSQTVTQGNGTSYTVNLGAVNGFSGSVGLSVSGLPSGANGTFNPTSVSLPGTTSSTLNVTTSSTTPTGTYTLTISGQGPSTTHTTTVSLVVSAAAQVNYTLSASPSSVRLPKAGGTASYTVSVTPSGGFNSTVALSVSGLPAGATASFSPSSISGSGSSTLSVTATSSTPKGTYTLTITGTGGGITHTATVSLQIAPH